MHGAQTGSAWSAAPIGNAGDPVTMMVDIIQIR
jgi:hypothetical protein